jgi:flagellar biosynthesis protein FlhB
MADEAAEKQHQATGKRMAELAKRGQLMRSRDLTGGLIVITGVAVLFMLAPFAKVVFENDFILPFTAIKTIHHELNFPGNILKTMALNNLMLLAPIFMILLLIAFLSPFLFGGWNFTLEPFEFNFTRLNPVTNIQNLISNRIVVTMGRSFIKVVIIIGVLVYYMYSKRETISGLIHLPLKREMLGIYLIAQNFVIALSLALIVVIAIDVLYTYYDFQKRTKMSDQEIKEEHKESEGSPEAKRKRRAMQIGLFKQRLIKAVPRANVIITNPTHYAVALRYDDDKDNAPKVVAKGKGFLAEQIRNIAIANGVPLYQAHELARAIYHTSKLGQEIKPGLYMAVAIVLSYVHQLKRYQQGSGKPPRYVTDLEIPKEFLYHE